MKMSVPIKKDGKKTKLSLRKKTSKNVQEKEEGSLHMVTAPADLNETCEFKEPALFKRMDALSGIQKISKTSESAGASVQRTEDEGSGCMDIVTCQVCGKVLTHMSSTGRQQHVNRCIDKSVGEEQAVKEHQGLLERARKVILDCPMCGRPFKSKTTRLQHLKKCSKELGVGTDMLLKLCRDQEADRQAMLDKGILPDSCRNLKLKPKDPSKKRHVKEPKNQYEEDVQVALAISTSLDEQDKKHGTNPLPDVGLTNKGKPSKKGRKKTVYEDVCLLTTLSDIDRQRRLEDKVGNILQHNDTFTENREVKMKLLSSNCAVKCEEERGSSLWNKCALTTEDRPVEMFYVGQLIPPIVITHTSRSIKASRKVNVPGREVTFIEDKTHDQSDTHNMTASEDIITASTQTAVVLAELAMEDDRLDSSNYSPTTAMDTSIMSGTQTLGFCLQTLTMKEEDQVLHQKEAIEMYGQLVNNEAYSDVTITTLDRHSLHAHKLILSVRCPALLQMIENSRIHLEYTADTVLSLLQYIYTGQLSITTSVTEIINLAKKLELPAVVKVCGNLDTYNEDTEYIQNSNERHHCQEDLDSTAVGGVTQLDMKEVWGESESEAGDTDSVDTDQTEIEEEQYQEVRSTQRQHARDSLNRQMANKLTGCHNHVQIQSEDDNTTDTNPSPVKRDHTPDIERFDSSIETAYNTEHEIKDDVGRKLCFNKRQVIEKVNESNTGIDKKKYSNIENISIVLSSDDELIPSPKRTKLFDDSVEKEENNINKSVDLQEKDTVEEICVNVYHESKENLSCEPDTVVNTHNSSLNYSGADLFCSPSPAKQSRYTENLTGQSDSSQSLKHNSSSPINPEEDRSPDKGSCSLSDSIEDESMLYDNEPDIVDSRLDVDSLRDESNKELSVYENQTNLEPCSTHHSSYNSASSDYSSTDTRPNIRDLIKTHQSSYDNSNFDETLNEKNTTILNDQRTEVTGSKYSTLAYISPKFKDRDTQKLSPVSKNKNYVFKRNDNNEKSKEDVHLIDNVKELVKDDCDEGVDAHTDYLQTAEHDTDDLDTVYCRNKTQNSPKIVEKEIVSENICDNLTDNVQAESSSIGTVSTSCDSSGYEEIGLTREESELHDATSTGHTDTTYSNMDIQDTSCSNMDTDVWDDFNDDGMEYIPPDDTLHIPSNAARFVTPTLAGFQPKEKTVKPVWVPPSPFTPMPEYDKMATPALKKAVQQYGVKPVGKKRMVKVLTDIFQQTHQYETDSECEIVDMEQDDSSSEEDLVTASQPCGLEDVFEESCLHMASSDSDTSSSPQKTVDVHRRLYEYFRGDPALYKKVLTYEPVEFDVLKKALKDAGIKCSMDKLMDFLDERCIAFTTKNSRKNRKGRQKKRSPKKTTTKSPKKQKKAGPKSMT